MSKTFVMFRNLTLSHISMPSAILFSLEYRCLASPKEYQYFHTCSSSTFVTTGNSCSESSIEVHYFVKDVCKSVLVLNKIWRDYSKNLLKALFKFDKYRSSSKRWLRDTGVTRQQSGENCICKWDDCGSVGVTLQHSGENRMQIRKLSADKMTVRLGEQVFKL